MDTLADISWENEDRLADGTSERTEDIANDEDSMEALLYATDRLEESDSKA